MANYLFEGGYKNQSGEVRTQIILLHFIDNKNIHFIYSPHLDLTGYGNSLVDAQSSFTIAFEDFVDYTLTKNSLGVVLKELGWKIKGTTKNPKKLKAPAMSEVMKKNNYVSEIFDNYPTVQTSQQEVRLPAFA